MPLNNCSDPAHIKKQSSIWFTRTNLSIALVWTRIPISFSIGEAFSFRFNEVPLFLTFIYRKPWSFYIVLRIYTPKLLLIEKYSFITRYKMIQSLALELFQEGTLRSKKENRKASSRLQKKHSHQNSPLNREECHYSFQNKHLLCLSVGRFSFIPFEVVIGKHFHVFILFFFFPNCIF